MALRVFPWRRLKGRGAQYSEMPDAVLSVYRGSSSSMGAIASSRVNSSSSWLIRESVGGMGG